MCIGDEALASDGCPFDGSANFPGGPGANCFLGVVEYFTAKSSANIRRDNAHFMFGQAEDKCTHQEPDKMRVLGAGIQG